MSFINFTNLYKRAERLSSAVFLVSNTITDSDELRTKIRNLALNLVEYCVAIKDKITDGELKPVLKIESVLMEMASLLDIASVSGLVSPMNASILKQEFDFVIKDLNELHQYCNEKSEISQDFFKENGHNLMPESLTLMSLSPKLIKQEEAVGKGRNNRKEHREKAIIELLKAKSNIGIKDISKSIKGCSEKTIQRKLISLIKDGMVKKEGERRWSKYSLIIG